MGARARVVGAAALFVTSLGLAGCSSFTDSLAEAGDRTPSGQATSSSSPSSPSTSTPRPTPTTPTPSTPPDATTGPGTEVATDFGSVTYFGQRRPAAPGAPAPQQPGTEWVAIDVQLCVDADFPAGGGNIFDSAWTVVDSGNGEIQPSDAAYPQFPTPAYPVTARIEAGSCVRGWIVYPVVVGRDLRTVRYLPSIATTALAVWTA